MTLDDQRRGENESFFREVNERLELVAVTQESGNEGDRSFEIVCECAVEECTLRLRVPLVEYEFVRADPRQFIVAHGHADIHVERIMRSLPAYDVVEKLGEAGELAENRDPRGDE
jgi:hypothetical protein